MNKEEDVVAPAMATVPVPVLEAAATVAGESRPTAAVTTMTTGSARCPPATARLLVVFVDRESSRALTRFFSQGSWKEACVV